MYAVISRIEKLLYTNIKSLCATGVRSKLWVHQLTSAEHECNSVGLSRFSDSFHIKTFLHIDNQLNIIKKGRKIKLRTPPFGSNLIPSMQIKCFRLQVRKAKENPPLFSAKSSSPWCCVFILKFLFKNNHQLCNFLVKVIFLILPIILVKVKMPQFFRCLLKCLGYIYACVSKYHT